MSKSAKLTIQTRERTSKGAIKQLRREGFLPGSINEKGKDAISFSVKKDDLRRALLTHGMSSVYTLAVDKKTAYSAMVREIQYAPVTREWVHITFQIVSLTEETTAEIPIVLNGRDDVTYNGFELLQQLETLSLRGLPMDFPTAIELEVAAMEPGQQITVADVQLPEGISCDTEADRLILSVSYPKVRAEEAAEGEEAAEDAAPEAAEAAAPASEE